MNLIQLAEAGDTAGVLQELRALTPAQRAAHAGELAACAEAMAAGRAGYTDKQRFAQRVAELGCQASPEAAADWLVRNPPRHPIRDQHPSYDQYPGSDQLLEVANLYPPDWRAELVARLAAPTSAKDLTYRWFPLA